MKTIIFDGKSYARKIEDELYHKIGKLRKKPIMVTIIVGEDPASKLYVRLKKDAAARVGAEMDVMDLPENISEKELIRKINHLAEDETLSGIMIQLPLPKHLREKTDHIIHHIPAHLDVDGMREDSPFMPATVRAVISILDFAKKKINIAQDSYVAVVGAKGEVGSKLVEILSHSDYEVGAITRGMDEVTFAKELSSARVIISATGEPNLITENHVSKGAVVIDVGSPKGDVDFDKAKHKAGFITPVPGGVGPVTVVSLLQNLVESSRNIK